MVKLYTYTILWKASTWGMFANGAETLMRNWWSFAFIKQQVNTLFNSFRT